MDRTEPPSEEKLQVLRDEGEIPYSRFTVHGAVWIVTLWWCSHVAMTIGRMWESWLSAPTLGDISGAEMIREVLSLVALGVGGALGGALAAGLVFTRFWFRLSLHSRSHQGDVQGVVPAMGRLVLGGALGCYLFLALTPSVWELLAMTPDARWTGEIAAVLMFGGIVSAAIFAFGCVVAGVVARFTFRRRHRMTRREMLAQW